jgi:hypothetical protein
MPYIDTKDVAAMRKAIRAALPGYKISVTKHHCSSVEVAILAGPIVGTDNVNVYHYRDNLGPEKLDRPDAVAVVDTIIAEIFKVRQPETLVEDGDYGNVPTFYYDVRFGKWNEPYTCTDPDAADRLAIQQEFRKIDRWNEQRARYAAYKRERERKLRLVG